MNWRCKFGSEISRLLRKGKERRDSPLQLRRLQEEEGRRDRGVWLEVSRKPRSSNSRIKATERIPWSRIPSSRCVLEPGRERCGPFTERGGLPKVLQRERGTQERQRSRKQGVLGGKIVRERDKSARSDCSTLGAPEEAGDSCWDTWARSEELGCRQRVGGCGATAPHLS